MASLTMPSFEEPLNDNDTSFRIPPLKSMFPTPPSERPVTLEPSATLHVGEATSKLTGRQIALAQAETIDDPEPGDFEAVDLAKIYSNEAPRSKALGEHIRRKRKLAHQEQVLDFVHLPKPKPKLEEVNKKPFQPIAVLNELNEPPPSAALFPPITPSQEEHHSEKPHVNMHPNEFDAILRLDKGQRNSNFTEKPKRKYTRPRRNWTEAETNDLIEGIAICGFGRWKDILSHPKFNFHGTRTCVDLKDRFRTLYPQHKPEIWLERTGEVEPAKDLSLDSTKSSGKRKPSGIRTLYRNWSEQEDAELDKGFQKHGYQWHLIAQDETLRFEARTGGQIRDRFRRRYPETYSEPAPGKEKITNEIKEKPSRTRSRRNKSASEAKQNGSNPARPSTKEKSTVSGSAGTTAPTFPNGLLNDRDSAEEESEFTKSLAALDEDLRLPPLQWGDMAVQPIFDLG